MEKSKMKTLYLLSLFALLNSCTQIKLNKPQWRASSDERASATIGIPWTPNSNNTNSRGYIELIDIGKGVKEELINQIILYISDGDKGNIFLYELIKNEFDQRQWIYNYDELTNQLRDANIDTSYGKCQGVLEVHYNNKEIIYFVAPSYLGFNNKLKTIELVK